MASDTMKKSVRHYENMRDSGIEWIGAVPSHWKTTRMKAIFKAKSVKNHPSAEVLSLYRDFGVLPKSSRDDNHNVTSEDTSQYKYVEKDNLVINKMKAWQGSLAISKYEGIVSPAYYVCEFRNAAVDKKYIHHLLRCTAYAQEFERLSTGMRIGQWDLGIDDFMLVPAILPPLNEQKHIGHYLDTQCLKIDTIISDAKTSIEEYKAWKTSIIYESVTKGLDSNVEMKDSGIEWIGQIPVHWTCTKLSNVFNVIGSGTTPDSGESSYYNGNISWLQSGDLNANIVLKTARNITKTALDKYSALHIYKAPYIAVAMYGASIANASIVKVDSCTNQACCVLSSPKPYISLDYIFYAILSAKRELLLSARGGTQPNISQDIIKRLLLPIPPISEQEAIGKKLGRFNSLIDNLIREKERLIVDLEDYKKSLIFEAVTGKRKVV